MLLSSMRELLRSTAWDWDFVINLSESDFPVKSVEKLVDFMTANKKKNFVRSHGRETQRFIQKQGLDKTFVECDTHMWRIGDRELPHGIQIDGGSDWVALDRDFVEYVTQEDGDTLLGGLLKVFKHTLLPAESFFHTVLRNSKFCGTYIDNNLHVTNWKRRLGCKCQYKHVVDWCGCSPNDFKPDDWARLQATEAKQLFFARKFEPIINQAVILQLEEWLFGPYPSEMQSLNGYWQNIYHTLDKSPKPDDGLLTVAHSLIRTGFVDFLNDVLRVNVKREQLFDILEVSNFMEYDHFKGFLVLFEATIDFENKAKVVRFEILARGTQLTQSNKKSKLAKRIVLMEVSSEYDQKEQVSRNYPRVLSSHSEPVLVFHIKGSKSDNETSYNLTVLWIDPAGNLADVSDVTVEEQPNAVAVSYAKSNLRHPLIPGIWTAKLLTKRSAIAFCKFLVTPLEVFQGKPITDDKARVINLGVRNDPNQIHSEWDKYLLPLEERQPLEEKIVQSAKKTGDELHRWIDHLVKHFYLVQSHCVVVVDSETNYETHGKVLGKKMEECSATSWSSLSYDPKSDIRGLQ